MQVRITEDLGEGKYTVNEAGGFEVNALKGELLVPSAIGVAALLRAVASQGNISLTRVILDACAAKAWPASVLLQVGEPL